MSKVTQSDLDQAYEDVWRVRDAVDAYYYHDHQRDPRASFKMVMNDYQAAEVVMDSLYVLLKRAVKYGIEPGVVL